MNNFFNKYFLSGGLALAAIVAVAQDPQAPQRILPKKEAATPQNKSKYELNDFYKKNAQLDRDVEILFQKLSSDEKAAQMIMPAIGIKNFGLTPEKALELYKNKKVGGFLFLKGTTDYFKQTNQQLIDAAKANNLVPSVNSCDGEAALIHYKFTNIAKQVPAESQQSYEDVAKSSRQLTKLIDGMGIDINFAPVVDNNINRAIISNRSFGATADEIVPKAGAFVMAHQAANKVAVIKHFPGHGAVSGDSHKGLVSIKGPFTELESFDKVIDNANPIGAMVGHIAVSNNTKWNTNGQASTLSRKITTELLKDSLGFKGIAFTDAMNMGAVSKIPDASFKAACAGIDIVLMPLNPTALHTQIKKELDTNGKYAKQFNESIRKILRLKLCLGLI